MIQGFENKFRFQASDRGHVESYFWRANDPQSRRAFWLKATVLHSPKSSSTVADAWCCTFDGETGQMWGGRTQVDFQTARFDGDPLNIEIGPCTFLLDPKKGWAKGHIKNAQGACEWDIHWRPMDISFAAPLELFPYRWMLRGGFPRSKTISPHPALEFSGSMKWNGRPVAVSNWWGMQGHNWGREHTPRYAWGQCIFGTPEQPVAMVEGFSGRIRMGGRLSPPISAMTIRHNENVYRFDRLIDLWNQTVSMDSPTWILALKGPAGRAQLTMETKSADMVCLGYYNPDGRLSYCLNSKLARAKLELQPRHGEAVSLMSEHGGALEFLVPENPGFEHVV